MKTQPGKNSWGIKSYSFWSVLLIAEGTAILKGDRLGYRPILEGCCRVFIFL